MLTWTAGSGCFPGSIIFIPLRAVVVALLCFEAVVWCRALGSVHGGVSSSQHRSHSPEGHVMDPSPEQEMGCWDVVLLSLQTRMWDESCGWMLNGSALLADLKQRLDTRFLANRVSACHFAQARIYSQGCRGAKDSPPCGKTGAAVTSSDFPLVSPTVA